MERLDVQRWMQLKYGKPVEEDNGPIVAGSEHKTTGATSDIDADLYTHMTPSSVGIGSNDRTDWREYTWLDEGGGMVTQLHRHNDEFLFIAGRVCGRTESGKRLGRMYTEAHYASLPVAKHHFPTALGLLNSLQTTPQLVTADFTLSPLDVTSISLPLPDNWLDLVSPILKVLLSGLPLSIKTTKRSLQEMTELVHIVQSSLPNTLVWRLTTKIGAIECAPSDAILSIVQSSNFNMPRMIGFSMSDAEKNHHKIKNIDHAIPHPLIEGEVIGLRYIKYLTEKCQHCKTTMDLQTQVHTDFNKLRQWDYFPVEQDFSEASITFIQILFEDDGIAQLQTALQDGGELPSLKVFFYRKREALISLLHHAWNHPTIILQSIELWKDVWDELIDQCPSDLIAIANILHPKGPITTGTFAVFKEAIPEPFNPLIHDKLTKWFNNISQSSTPVPLWLEFIEQYDQYGQGIKLWIQRREQEISLMMRYVYNTTTPIPLPFGQWLHTLSMASVNKNFNTKNFSISKVIDTQPQHLQIRFVEELYHLAPLVAIHEVLNLPNRPDDISNRDQHMFANILQWQERESFWVSQSQASRLVSNFITVECNPTYTSDLFEHILMHQFEGLSRNDQDVLWPFFSTKVGDWIARVLFQRSSNLQKGSFDAFYLEQLPMRYREGHPQIQHIFEYLFTNKSIPYHDELIDICKRILRQDTHQHPLPVALKQIQQHKLHSVPSIDPAMVSFWLSQLSFNLELINIEGDETLCEFFFQLKPPFQTPSSDLLGRLFKEQSHGSQVWKKWENRLKTHQWDTQESWRILFIQHIPNQPLAELSLIEKQLLQRMQVDIQAHCLYIGLSFEPSNLKALTMADFNRLPKKYQAMLIWWGVHYNQSLLRVVLPFYIRNMPKDERETLHSEISSTFSMFSSWMQKVTSSLDAQPTALPIKLNPTVWIKEYLLSQSKTERLQWFA